MSSPAHDVCRCCHFLLECLPQNYHFHPQEAAQMSSPWGTFPEWLIPNSASFHLFLDHIPRLALKYSLTKVCTYVAIYLLAYWLPPLLECKLRGWVSLASSCQQSGFRASLQHLVAVGGPWCFWACSCISSVCPHLHRAPSSVSVCWGLISPSSCEDTSHWIYSPPYIREDLFPRFLT